MESDPKTSHSDILKVSDGYDFQSIQKDIAYIKQTVRSGSEQSLEILTRQEWQYISDKYVFLGFLINQKIVLYWVKGEVRKKDSQAVFERMKAIIQYTNNASSLYHILDLSHISSFSLSARKAYEKISTALAHHWKHSYYVLSSLGTTIFRIYSTIHAGFSQQITLTESLSKAIHFCFKKTDQKPEILATKPSFDPSLASHGELLEAYTQLEAKHKKLHQLHQDRAKKILEIIGKISWDEPFDAKSIQDHEDDSFYNVFGALALLQYDMSEILHKQKALNHILEKEVAIRTYQLGAVIEHTSEMIMSVDRNWRVQVVNSAFRERFRQVYQQQIRSGDFLLSKYPEHLRDFWRARFERGFSGESYQEIVTETVQQQTTYFQVTFNPICEPGEEVQEVSIFGQDITNLRKAEEKAKEYEGNLINALRIARAGCWELDLQTREINIGKEGLAILGLYSEQNLIISFEAFIERFLHPDDVVHLQERLAWAEQHQDDPEFQDQFPYRLYHQSGKILQLMLYSHYKANAHKVIFGISQDITAQKEAEEKLLRQNLDLKKVNSELDQFVYSVSHDLRAPLSSVLGLINIARHEQDRGTLMHYLDLQEKSILKLDAFIREIMDLSKNARLTIQKEPIDFQQLVNEVFEEQQYDQDTTSIEKISHIEQINFHSDVKRVKVILRNLISNALRYANLNQAHPFVAVRVYMRDKEAIVEIEDNGLGIHPDHQPYIFKMFYRANESKSGSGLGLYIVKETVDKLSGNVRVYSLPGKMTKFTVSLPDLG